MGMTLNEFFIHKMREAVEEAPGMGKTFSKVDPAAAGAAPAFAAVAEQVHPLETVSFFTGQKAAILGNLGNLGQDPAVAKGLDAFLAGMDRAMYTVYSDPATTGKQKFSEDWASAAAKVQGVFNKLGDTFNGLTQPKGGATPPAAPPAV